MEEVIEKLCQLKKSLEVLKEKLKLEEKKEEVKKLSQQTSSLGFWDNQFEAQKTTKLLAFYTDEISSVDQFEKRLQSLEELSQTGDSELLFEDIKKELSNLEKEIGKLELKTYLGGKYDTSAAIISIHAGQGGTEAMDWAQMLMRMYFRFAEKKDWKVEVVDSIAGDEAGIKNVVMIISGPFAYGYLKGERGAHRLVRQSPFNADKLRQTSVALVEVLPQIEESKENPIPESDLEWEFFHASSHGGQNVQKVSTAVRLHHKPTGIIVTSQSERYQERNRGVALNLLRAKLWEIEEEKRLKERKSLKGEYKLAGWGNQIRSYVLHPYKMVKDLRTEHEENDPFLVLDGELDGFIDAELKFLLE